MTQENKMIAECVDCKSDVEEFKQKIGLIEGILYVRCDECFLKAFGFRKLEDGLYVEEPVLCGLCQTKIHHYFSKRKDICDQCLTGELENPEHAIEAYC